MVIEVEKKLKTGIVKKKINKKYILREEMQNIMTEYFLNKKNKDHWPTFCVNEYCCLVCVLSASILLHYNLGFVSLAYTWKVQVQRVLLNSTFI